MKEKSLREKANRTSRKPAARKTRAGPEILITGATGFIGRRLALTLAERGHWLWLLCRPRSVGRLAPLLHKLPAGAKRPEVIEGDLRHEDLGISAVDRKKLGRSIKQVYHVAAGYDLGMPEDVAMTTNAEGTRRMLDLAADLPGLSRFHFVSTMAVAGNYDDTFGEKSLDVGQGFDHAYGRSKFLAESFVRGETSRLPCTIYRPGVVVGDSQTGEMDKIDGPYYVFSILHQLKRLPGASRMPMIVPRDEGSYFHVVPVDFVVKALIEIGSRPESKGQTYHLMDPDPPSFREFYTETLAAMGFGGPQISRPVARLVRLLKSRPFWPLARAASRAAGIPAELMCHYLYTTRYDTTNTEKHLTGSDITCPRFKDYLPVLTDYFERNMI